MVLQVFKDDAAAVTTVAAIGATTGYKFLASETGQTVSSLAGFGKYTNVIYEHGAQHNGLPD